LGIYISLLVADGSLIHLIAHLVAHLLLILLLIFVAGVQGNLIFALLDWWASPILELDGGDEEEISALEAYDYAIRSLPCSLLMASCYFLSYLCHFASTCFRVQLWMFLI